MWLDGRLVEADKACVPIESHALHYGTCAFEGIRFYETENGSAVFRLSDHLKRLRYSARRLGMKGVPTGKDLTEAVIKTVKSSKLTSGYIRPIVFFREGGLGLSVANSGIGVAVIVLPWKDYLPKGGIAVKTSSWRRISGTAFDPKAKLGGPYVNSVLAHSEAVKGGASEALLLDEKGYVAEGPGENVFVVKGKKLMTPAEGCILPGITRDSIMKIASDRGYTVVERRVRLREVYEADEFFMVGTAAEVTPVVKLDGSNIGDGTSGSVTGELASLYKAVVTGGERAYRRWLTDI